MGFKNLLKMFGDVGQFLIKQAKVVLKKFKQMISIFPTLVDDGTIRIMVEKNPLVITSEIVERLD